MLLGSSQLVQSASCTEYRAQDATVTNACVKAHEADKIAVACTVTVGMMRPGHRVSSTCPDSGSKIAQAVTMRLALADAGYLVFSVRTIEVQEVAQWV